MKIAIALGSLLVIAGCGGGEAVHAPPSAPPVSAASAPAPAASSVSSAEPIAGGQPAVPPFVQSAVAAEDRSADDKALDAGRKPAELLSFCAVPKGGKVAELAAGGGYTTELLARAVGLTGKVWGQNSKWILEKFAEKPWSVRLAKPVNKNVVRVDREFDDPLPPDAKDLDVVVVNLFYHDTFWMKVDRDKMNKAVFAALKPGGVYCIVDHSGRPGTGATEVSTLHRVEEKTVRDDVEKAGFKLAAESNAWRNPSDARDWNAAPFAAKEKRGTSDRFALKFVKP